MQALSCGIRVCLSSLPYLLVNGVVSAMMFPTLLKLRGPSKKGGQKGRSKKKEGKRLWVRHEVSNFIGCYGMVAEHNAIAHNKVGLEVHALRDIPRV